MLHLSLEAVGYAVLNTFEYHHIHAQQILRSCPNDHNSHFSLDPLTSKIEGTMSMLRKPSSRTGRSRLPRMTIARKLAGAKKRNSRQVHDETTPPTSPDVSVSILHSTVSSSTERPHNGQRYMTESMSMRYVSLNDDDTRSFEFDLESFGDFSDRQDRQNDLQNHLPSPSVSLLKNESITREDRREKLKQHGFSWDRTKMVRMLSSRSLISAASRDTDDCDEIEDDCDYFDDENDPLSPSARDSRLVFDFADFAEFAADECNADNDDDDLDQELADELSKLSTKDIEERFKILQRGLVRSARAPRSFSGFYPKLDHSTLCS